MSLKKAREAILTIALKEGITAEEVRKNIQEVIDMGMTNPDPAVKQFWDAVPHQGERPSPEEVILYIAHI